MVAASQFGPLKAEGLGSCLGPPVRFCHGKVPALKNLAHHYSCHERNMPN